MYKSGGSIQSQTTHNSENHYFSRFPNCLVLCPLLGVKTLVFLETTVKGFGEKEENQTKTGEKTKVLPEHQGFSLNSCAKKGL